MRHQLSLTNKASDEYWEKSASEERKAIRKRNHEELKKEDMSKLTPTEVLVKRYTADTPLRFYDPEYDMSGLWEGVVVNMDFVNHYWKLIYGYESSGKYHLIKAPVLIFSGRYDFGCPYYLYDEVKDKIPYLTFILFEKAGHNPMLEVQAEFDKKLLNWIKSTK